MRATFSVRIERRTSNVETAYATLAARSIGRTAVQACVTSSEKTIAVSGTCSAAASRAAIATAGQKPSATCGRKVWASAPPAAPTNTIGATTPPLVPDPSDSDQMSDFTTNAAIRVDTATLVAVTSPIVE